MDIRKVVEGMIETAIGAGELILDRSSIEVKQKGDVSNIVTSMDLKSQNYILERLVKLVPEAKIIAEESKDNEFPHEIGVFFGYPLEDVKSYIENNGENALYVGYWKVYHNVEKCVDIFKTYDEEKTNAFNELINGKSITQIMCA